MNGLPVSTEKNIDINSKYFIKHSHQCDIKLYEPYIYEGQYPVVVLQSNAAFYHTSCTWVYLS